MFRSLFSKPSSDYEERQTPLNPLREALDAYKRAHPGEDPTFVVLIGTGSMNPVHKMHITMFDVAALYLKKAHGLVTLAGYISPSCDDYVWNKLGPDAISIKDRAEMCRLAAAEHNSREGVPLPIYVDLWEAEQPRFVDFPSVRERMDSVVHKHFPDEKIVVLYMCGMDLYNKCHLMYMDNVVAVARPPYTTSETPSPCSHNYVADAASDDQIRDLVCDCSSSEMRRRKEQSLPLDDLTFPSVIKYLDEKFGWFKK